MSNFLKTVLISVTLGCLVSACSGYSITGGPGKAAPAPLQSQVQHAPDLLTVNSLLVAPIALDPRLISNSSLHDPSRLYERMATAFRSNSDLELLAGSDVLRNFPKSTNKLVALEQAKATGRELNADAVLFTELHEFLEREGSQVGANRPASVYFTTRIIRLSDNHEVWRASFRYRDQALTDNLLKLERRLQRQSEYEAGWQSAFNLVDIGFREAARDFAARRNAAFSNR